MGLIGRSAPRGRPARRRSGPSTGPAVDPSTARPTAAARRLAARAALCSLGTIVGLALFATRFLGRRAAVFVMILFTFSNIHIEYAREARAYALVSLLCVASAAAYLELIRRPRLATACVLGLTNAFLVYAHYVTIFVWVVQAAATALQRGWRSRAGYHVALAMVIALVLIAPWLPFALRNVPRTGAFWLEAPTWLDLGRVLKRFAGRRWVTYAPLVLLAPPVRRRIGFAREAWDPGVLHYLAIWAFLPIAGAFAVSAWVPIFLDRYLLYSSLGLLLLIAYVLQALPVGKTGAAVIALVVTVFLFPKALHESLKDDWRRLAVLVHAHHDPRPAGTSLVLIAPVELVPFAYYYDHGAFTGGAELTDPLQRAGVIAVEDVREVEAARVAQAHAIWVVRTRDTRPDVTALGADHTFGPLRSVGTVQGLELLVAKREVAMTGN